MFWFVLASLFNETYPLVTIVQNGSLLSKKYFCVHFLVAIFWKFDHLLFLFSKLSTLGCFCYSAVLLAVWQKLLFLDCFQILLFQLRILSLVSLIDCSIWEFCMPCFVVSLVNEFLLWYVCRRFDSFVLHIFRIPCVIWIFRSMENV